MATRYHCRPSQLLGVDPTTEPYLAFCIDQAALWAGAHEAPDLTKRRLQGTEETS